MRNFNWLSQEWKPMNHWGATLNMSKVDRLVQQAISGVFMSIYRNRDSCKMGPVVELVNRFACACGEDKKEGCFGGKKVCAWI